MALRNRARRGRVKARELASEVRGEQDKTQVPGPTYNPATNLLMADIVMRMGSYALRGTVERAFLKGRYGKNTAKDIMKNRSIVQTFASIGIAKLGTRSLPGAAVVGSGILAKVLYDRGKSRHEAKREGDAELLGQLDDS